MPSNPMQQASRKIASPLPSIGSPQERAFIRLFDQLVECVLMVWLCRQYEQRREPLRFDREKRSNPTSCSQPRISSNEGVPLSSEFTNMLTAKIEGQNCRLALGIDQTIATAVVRVSASNIS